MRTSVPEEAEMGLMSPNAPKEAAHVAVLIDSAPGSLLGAALPLFIVPHQQQLGSPALSLQPLLFLMRTH